MSAPIPQRLILNAGPLAMVFETETAFLRTIKLGDIEVLRGIYSAVRDHNWDTAPPGVTNLRLVGQEQGFDLTFDVSAKLASVDFHWHGIIRGTAEGTVRYEMDGEARSTFRRNRLGFCVLHPHSCAGLNCTIETTNGEKKTGVFPRYVAPHQPFVDLAAISHEVTPGVTAEVRFEGEIFETEDQRNWTDASYKTYCTPLDLPFPVEVQQGTRVRQAVTLSVTGVSDRFVIPSVDPTIDVSVDWQNGFRLPQIGLGLPEQSRQLSSIELSRFKVLSLAHFRVDLQLNQPTWRERLYRAVEDATRAGVRLEMALHVSDEAPQELNTLYEELRQIDAGAGSPVGISRWLVFHVDEKCTQALWVKMAKMALSDVAPHAAFAAGTNAYFAELNRGQVPVDEIDTVCYSINPQVHAFDDRSLVETIEGQGATVESARQLAPGCDVAVSPITLKPRFNPNATGPEPEPASGELPSSVDPRQAECFTAGWTLGALKYLSEGGADSLTYFETTGWRGIMEAEEGLPLPDVFHSIPGALFPVYHLLADVGAFADGTCHHVDTSDPLRVTGLALQKNDQTIVLLANLTSDPLSIQLHIPGFSHAFVRVLDVSSSNLAMTDPETFRSSAASELALNSGRAELDIHPHAYLRILLES